MNLIIPLIHDPVALLKEDHELIKDIVRELNTPVDDGADKRASLFTELKNQLGAHLMIEEKIFYPALQEIDQMHDIILAAHEEHRVLKGLLAALEKTPSHTDEWKAMVTVFKKEIEHHVQEEKHDIFKKAKELLDNDELERLGVEARAMKQSKITGM